MKAYFAGGCFWCLEAVYQRVKGVSSVISGYAGGHIANPTYAEVGGGETGHAETVEVEYDPEVVTYKTLLEIFFTVHDPTTLNRQGSDVGPQYRSAIFTTANSQKQEALQFIQKLREAHEYVDTILTEVEPLAVFYPATRDHQDYFSQNQEAPYCQLVISPKIQKFEKKFASFLKE